MTRHRSFSWIMLGCAGLVLGMIHPTPTCLADGREPSEPEIKKFKADFEAVGWQTKPGIGRLGNVAQIDVPAGYRFTGAAGAAKWSEMTQNPPDPSEVGVLMPVNNFSWFLVFSYNEIGFVSDKERDQLDPDAILESLRQGTEAGNVERRRRGWTELTIAGWIVPPAYEDGTNRLIWATRCVSQGGEAANYDIRLLGRKGVMQVKLVASPNQVEKIVPQVNQLLEKFEFTTGNKYAEWQAGDKVAAYGLTGLITGGAVIAAAKTGLLAKFFGFFAKFAKILIIAVIAMGAFVWNLLFGSRKNRE